MRHREVIYLPNFSPTAKVACIPPDQACQVVNKAMQKWCKPDRIKLDNGLPFVLPKCRDIPTLSQLWWIGLGIQVQLNAPKVPEQNGTVEGLQGICKRWSNPGGYQTMAAYQKRIDETNRIQREVYRIRRQGDKTRKELYPELWKTEPRYDPRAFSMDLIYQFLATKVWQRTVKLGGNLKFWAQEIYIGTRFKHQPVTITFDPLDCQWIIRATDGTLLKTTVNKCFTKDQILKHAGISKN